MSNQNHHNEILERTTTDLLSEKKKLHLERIVFHQQQIDEINRMTGLVKPTNGNGTLPLFRTPPRTEQKKRMSWTKPILQLLEKEKRLLKTREIVHLLFVDIDEDTINEYIIKASGVLFALCTRKKVKQYKEKGVKGDFYGLPDFFNGDKPKHEYMKK